MVEKTKWRPNFDRLDGFIIIYDLYLNGLVRKIWTPFLFFSTIWNFPIKKSGFRFTTHWLWRPIEHYGDGSMSIFNLNNLLSQSTNIHSKNIIMVSQQNLAWQFYLGLDLNNNAVIKMLVRNLSHYFPILHSLWQNLFHKKRVLHFILKEGKDRLSQSRLTLPLM